MADKEKLFRPITDVEIVAQMTENDTVLIEQGGEIKRTKGVVGSGGSSKPVAFYVSNGLWKDVNWSEQATLADIVDAYFAGNAYINEPTNEGYMPQKIIGFNISASNPSVTYISSEENGYIKTETIKPYTYDELKTEIAKHIS